MTVSAGFWQDAASPMTNTSHSTLFARIEIGTFETRSQTETSFAHFPFL
jgi:hypothetical protein